MNLAPFESPESLANLASRVEFYVSAASSESTRKAYASDMRQFQQWCESKVVFSSLPTTPGAVALYLAHLADAGKKVATIERALIAIRKAHEVAEHEDPTANRGVKEAMKGIRRTLGTVQKKAAPLLVDPLKRIVETLDLTRLKDLRDRAMLCLGFSTGMRRSELVALNAEDLKVSDLGLSVTIRRSKTDQEGAGRSVVVLRGVNGTCPVKALSAWLDAAGITEGPVFVYVDRHGKLHLDQRLTDQVVLKVIRKRAEEAGVPGFENLSGHSLRAGLATQAAMNGALERDIAKQTGHKSEKVLKGYIREADLWRNNVTEGLGL